MKDEALKLALEALEAWFPTWPNLIEKQKTAIAAIKQALAAPVQEPAAWSAGTPPLYPEMKDGEIISAEYHDLTPPAAQRQWVEMSDARIKGIFSYYGQYVTGKELAMLRVVETMLKENT
jgi:hypothetical protein